MGEGPNAEEAGVSLAEAERARRAAVETTRRPAGLDGLYALALGVAVGLAITRATPLVLAAGIVLVAASALYWLIERRDGRRRGRILDERAVGAYALRYMPVYFVVFVLFQIHADPARQPWFSAGVALLVAGAGFAYLRLDDRYQAHRLASGDYRRGDLV